MTKKKEMIKNNENTIVSDTELTELEETLSNEMVQYADDHRKPLLNRKGDEIGEYIDYNPAVINNLFFKPIIPNMGSMPRYNAKKLEQVYEYYNFLVTEINDKIGVYPPSLGTFCKVAGLTMAELEKYKVGGSLDVQVVVGKIYDEIGDNNLVLAQMGKIKEATTTFKLKAEHNINEKKQPNINVSLKQSIDTSKLDAIISKYEKIGDITENDKEKNKK